MKSINFVIIDSLFSNSTEHVYDRDLFSNHNDVENSVPKEVWFSLNIGTTHQYKAWTCDLNLFNRVYSINVFHGKTNELFLYIYLRGIKSDEIVTKQ